MSQSRIGSMVEAAANVAIGYGVAVAQVRQIRMHASFGREFSDVADVTGSSVSQVKRVLSGDAYGRIK